MGSRLIGKVGGGMVGRGMKEETGAWGMRGMWDRSDAAKGIQSMGGGMRRLTGMGDHIMTTATTTTAAKMGKTGKIWKMGKIGDIGTGRTETMGAMIDLIQVIGVRIVLMTECVGSGNMETQWRRRPVYSDSMNTVHAVVSAVRTVSIVNVAGIGGTVSKGTTMHKQCVNAITAITPATAITATRRTQRKGGKRGEGGRWLSLQQRVIIRVM
jgi:hypothetical protein